MLFNYSLPIEYTAILAALNHFKNKSMIVAFKKLMWYTQVYTAALIEKSTQ